MFRLYLLSKYVSRPMKESTSYVYWACSKEVGFSKWHVISKFLLCSYIFSISCIFITYCKRSLSYNIRALFCVHWVEFLPKRFLRWLSDDVIIVVILLLCIYIVHFNCKFESGTNPYSLNCWKYLGIALKLIVRSTTRTPK